MTRPKKKRATRLSREEREFIASVTRSNRERTEYIVRLLVQISPRARNIAIRLLHDKRWSLLAGDDNWIIRFDRLRPLPIEQVEEEILSREADLHREGSGRVQ